MNILTIGSLFSGIGGLELGLEWGLNEAGIATRVAWQCEIEDYPRRVLARHWPETRRYEDVRTIGRAESIEPVDLICGGFPCQDLSYTGKRAGLQGERSGLFWELMRVVRLVRPRYVVLENVPGLLTADQGGAMGSVLGALAESGYDAEWDCIPAAAVGAPHIRDRVFIVAHDATHQSSRQEDVYVSHMHSERWRPEVAYRRSGCTTLPRSPWECSPKPSIWGVPDGLSDWLDRLAALGNAVVPQVARVLGQRIAMMEAQS